MSALIRVRVKCPSMNQSKLEIKQRKEKENEWDRCSSNKWQRDKSLICVFGFSWVKEKQQRIARLHKIRNKINKSVAVAGGMMPNDAPTMEDNDKIIVSVIEGPVMNKDGYTRLEVD